MLFLVRYRIPSLLGIGRFCQEFYGTSLQPLVEYVGNNLMTEIAGVSVWYSLLKYAQLAFSSHNLRQIYFLRS